MASVIEYFYLEINNMGPLKDVKKVLESVADACKVPYRTVRRINAQLKETVQAEGSGEAGATWKLRI